MAKLSKLIKKICTRKRVCKFFAIATFMPFLSIIATNSNLKLENLLEVKAATIIDKFLFEEDPAGFVTAPSDRCYVDGTNNNIYSKPYTNGSNKSMVTAVINLDKKYSKAIRAYYHLENYTAIAGEDYAISDQKYVVINPLITSVNVEIETFPSTFGVRNENSDFTLSRAFRFVLDSLEDNNGKTFEIYDGKDNGYRNYNGFCKNDVLCLCGNKYSYTAVDQFETDYKVEGVKMFDDYKDFLTQEFGTGEGNKDLNNYDIGGRPWKEVRPYSMYYGSTYASDNQYGRKYKTDMGAYYDCSGSFRVVPYKTHEYYDRNTNTRGTYKDWLNRIVKTGLGHSYGSFNAKLNGWGYPEGNNYVQEFYLGDYSFVSNDTDGFGTWLKLEDDPYNYINDNNWTWGIHLRLNYESNESNTWYVDTNSLIQWSRYIQRVAKGDYKLDEDEKILGGYNNNPKFDIDKLASTGIQLIDYGERVCNNYNKSEDKKICWFVLPNNDTEETFGFNLFHQHDKRNWFTYYNSIGMFGNTFFTVLDDVNPTLDKTEGARATIETSSLATTGKIRMSVRFSEPVQTFEHSYFIASLASGVDVQFRPVAGQLPGCDTICYEADTSSLTDIISNRLTVKTGILYDSVTAGDESDYYAIRDFGQSGGRELITKDSTKYLLNQSYDINLVKKNPVITPIETSISKTAKKNATAEINLSYMPYGKLYYTFIRDDGQSTIVPEFSDQVVSTDSVYSNVIQETNIPNNTVVKLEMPQSATRTGDYYCFIKAVSSLGSVSTFPANSDSGVDVKTGIGPFKVDNTVPIIKITKDTEKFNANERKFHIEVTENDYIDSVAVKLNKTTGELSEQVNTFDVKVTETAQNSHIFTGSFSLTLTSILDKYYSISETGKHVFIPDLEYEDFSLSFSAVDRAGNSTNRFIWEGEESSKPITLPYSAHESLPVTTSSSKESLISDIEGVNVFPTGTAITLKSTHDSEAVGYLEASVTKLPKTSSVGAFYEYYNDDTQGIHITQGEPKEKNKIVVTLDKPGNYEIVVRNKEGNYSDSYKYCISNNLADPTENATKALESIDLMPRVDAWQLNGDSCLYYLDESAKYHAKLYGGVYDPVFSSVSAAKNFVKMHEYEDLYLVRLTGQLADFLNNSGGVSGIARANLEQTVAREGDYWVRYKNSSWTVGSTASTSWGYYYYCKSTSADVSIDFDTINQNKILANQIDRVAELLANNGKKIYLVDDNHIDPKTGAPKLSNGQIEISKGFVLTQSLSGSPINSIVCSADSDLYANTVSVNNGESTTSYRLASNMPVTINDSTTLYATPAIGEPHYYKIDCKEGTPLKDALNVSGVATSGIYKILEISSSGANLFEVYIDKDNPYAEVERSIYDAVEGSTVSTTSEVDGSYNIDFYSKEFSINGIPTSKLGIEVDEYSYVAIFRGSKLLSCYYLNQINSPINLDDGIYNIVIGDRSGNRYSFRAFVSGDDINVQFKPIGGNSTLTINVTNREESELLKFETYCNNELVESDLTNPKSYSISGTYYVVVQDQYGNKYTSEPYTFTKKMPEIGIYYIDKEGYQREYKENDPNPQVVKIIGDDAILIKTCALLKITYAPSTTGISISNCPSDCYIINEEKGTVTFVKPCNFSFNVYYLDNESEYVSYQVIYDDAEPNIYGEYYSLSYDLLDFKPSNYNNEKGVPGTLDYITIQDTLSGGEVKKTGNISNGSTISTDYMYFRVSDNTQVKYVIVTKDGVEVPVTFLDQGFNGFEFYLEALPGHYIITACDIFGKNTPLEFNVDSSIFTDAQIDGKNVEPVGPSDDGEHQVLYGNSDAIISCDVGSTVVILYSDENSSYAATLNCNATNPSIAWYELVIDGETADVRNDSNVTTISSFPYSPFPGVDLVISLDKNGVITITYHAGSSKANLDVRASRNNECFNLYNMEFSSEFKTPKFMDQGYEIQPKGNYIYAGKEVIIVDDANEIIDIVFAYNEFEESFDDATYFAYDEEYNFKNGFYKFIITNKYGVKQEYIAIVSDVLSVNVTETFLDKENEVYSLGGDNVFMSNNTVVITGYNIATIQEESGYGAIVSEDAKTTITFTQPGMYTVKIIDKNNNRATITVIINSEEIHYDEDYICGYNEDALLKDEGYTNQTLSIGLDEESLNEKGITQIFFTYDDETYVLYGYKGDGVYVSYDEEMFKNSIGSLGDGIYKVYFSNQYGDVCIKEINYRETPTLDISRLTTSSLDSEIIAIEDAVINGVWSNFKINFGTSLGEEQYEFYVKSGDGEYEKQTVNYLFELPSSAAYGEIHYEVKYIDAYGNIYEMSVNLLRRQLSFNDINVNKVELDGTTYTRGNFSFEFDPEDVLVEYKLNGSDYDVYTSKDLIFKDGIYEFHMYDKAGNQVFYVITKDSNVTFKVQVDGQATNIYYGAAFNGSSATITSTALEDVKLVSAKLNGHILNTDLLTFTKTGHYELLLQDRIGNVEYFHFYMIGHEINSFDYIAPEDYTISAAYYINKDGIKMNAIDKISDQNTHIDLSNVPEGTYEIQIKNKYDYSITVVTITIDKTIPQAVLAGCNNGDVTTKDISLDKLQNGDIVTVYKDDEIVQQVEIGVGKDMKTITEGGNYRIVIENKAGSVVEYNFEKLSIANGALSTLIIIGLVGIAGTFFAVLVLRNRSKNDE